MFNKKQTKKKLEPTEKLTQIYTEMWFPFPYWHTIEMIAENILLVESLNLGP